MKYIRKQHHLGATLCKITFQSTNVDTVLAVIDDALKLFIFLSNVKVFFKNCMFSHLDRSKVKSS